MDTFLTAVEIMLEPYCVALVRGDTTAPGLRKSGTPRQDSGKRAGKGIETDESSRRCCWAKKRFYMRKKTKKNIAGWPATKRKMVFLSTISTTTFDDSNGGLDLDDDD